MSRARKPTAELTVDSLILERLYSSHVTHEELSEILLDNSKVMGIVPLIAAQS